jgi:hypothetical protein
VSPDRRRLVALAAVLAPARAVALLRRLGGPDGPLAVTHAGALIGATRRARLAALAASLASAPEPSLPPGLRSHPLLDRLRREAASDGDRPATPLLEPSLPPPSRPASKEGSRRAWSSPRTAAQTLVHGAAGPMPRPGPDRS